MYQKFGSCVPEKLISDKNVYCMVNVLCGTYAEKESSYLLSLIYMTTESDSSVIEQWARYPEVAGSIPAQIQLFKNFQISWPRPVQSIQSVQSSQSSPVQTSPDQSRPVQSSPVQSSLGQSSPVQSSPVQSSPVNPVSLVQSSPDQTRPSVQ